MDGVLLSGTLFTHSQNQMRCSYQGLPPSCVQTKKAGEPRSKNQGTLLRCRIRGPDALDVDSHSLLWIPPNCPQDLRNTDDKKPEPKLLLNVIKRGLEKDKTNNVCFQVRETVRSFYSFQMHFIFSPFLAPEGRQGKMEVNES